MSQQNSDTDRPDLREEWYRDCNPYAAFRYCIPNFYWIGLKVSALWLVGYLIIYPSIPFVFSQTNSQGIGMPGGCQPWTAICEMEQAEDELDLRRGKYLKLMRATPIALWSKDLELSEFIARAGRVRFADQCAGCHGQQGAGLAKETNNALVLNDATWTHGGNDASIKASIQSHTVHPFGLAERIDETSAKLLAAYVLGLSKAAQISID
jgi:cytochrome c oxidase cbb3-type subunit 3